ncbi:MAG TPA: SPFH domain-containing protein [Coriobacteriia bacterium]|jgi:regulator of protease activity HflC (stomatin/prohibitin superfamily)
MLGLSVFGIIVLALVFIAITGLRVATEYERAVIFRLGRLKGTRGPGLYWLIPLGIETQRKVDLRTLTIDIESQESITKDSVTVKVNAVVWMKIVDPVRSVVSVANYYAASYQVALTSLRNIIGQHFLDEVLKERDKINEALQTIVDQATEPWGVKVEMVEMKDVEIPQQMQRAMAQEAQAMREKRARIIKAEAEQEAAAKLAEASVVITQNPLALELRRMQMITEVGAEQNTTTILMLPTEFVTMAEAVSGYFKKQAEGKAE